MRRLLPALLVVALAVPVGATRQPVRARHGMVVAMESIAADVGVSVLQKGGNAIDAAVSVGFALPSRIRSPAIWAAAATC